MNKIDVESHNTESSVRSYCRAFPEKFVSAKGSYVLGSNGKFYIDFLSGCGSLNYGHNNERLKGKLIEYVERDGLVMSMDMYTEAKSQFLEAFSDLILKPRNLSYKLQFPGPTGANAIEAAIKLARKVTGRTNVIAFTNGFHGCSLGALSLTGSSHHRSTSVPLLNQVTRMPYDGYFGEGVDTTQQLEQMLQDPSSGVDAPAAIIFETVQGEGGLNYCSKAWAQKIQKIAKDAGSLLVVDDIQAGCGRTGTFFSFEPLGIEPDVICMAKAISGYGLPMSLTLIKPEYDIWKPGEHNGTFRGNNLAFVTAAEALKQYWSDTGFQEEILERENFITAGLNEIIIDSPLISGTKGKGMLQGIEFHDSAKAKLIQQHCFEAGLIVELCGPNDEVLKLLPSLNISIDDLSKGFEIIRNAISQVSKSFNESSMMGRAYA